MKWSVMTSILGNLQLPPATAHATAGEALPRPADSQAPMAAKPQSVIKVDLPADKPVQKKQPIVSDETHVAYSFDAAGHKLMVKITNQATGDVVRTLEFKGFSADTHMAKKLTGHLVDQKG